MRQQQSGQHEGPGGGGNFLAMEIDQVLSGGPAAPEGGVDGQRRGAGHGEFTQGPVKQRERRQNEEPADQGHGEERRGDEEHHQVEW